MQNTSKTLIGLETQFWQSMVDQDAGAALKLLNEPALMVSSYGAMQFDHAGYRKMAEQGTMIVTAFELKDPKVFFPNDTTAILTYGVKQAVSTRGESTSKTQEMVDSSTWVKAGDGWRCVMHTEAAAQPAAAKQH